MTEPAAPAAATDPAAADQPPAAATEPPTRPPWQVLAALSLVVVAIVVAIVLAKHRQDDPAVANAPLPVATVGQPGADTAACKALMPALPVTLAGSARRVLEGGGDSVAAWGDPAVILRCGIESPEELTCSAALVQVNGVSWLQLTEAGLDSTTYIAADRSVRIAVTVPTGSGSGGIGQISDVVAATLPVRAPCSAGVLLPTDQ